MPASEMLGLKNETARGDIPLDISEVALSLQMTSAEQRAWAARAPGSRADQPEGTAWERAAAHP